MTVLLQGAHHASPAHRPWSRCISSGGCVLGNNRKTPQSRPASRQSTTSIVCPHAEKRAVYMRTECGAVGGTHAVAGGDAQPGQAGARGVAAVDAGEPAVATRQAAAGGADARRQRLHHQLCARHATPLAPPGVQTIPAGCAMCCSSRPAACAPKCPDAVHD